LLRKEIRFLWDSERLRKSKEGGGEGGVAEEEEEGKEGEGAVIGGVWGRG